MAQELGMSVSSFYRHFKAVTAMTPLQFQKQLRLQEARRLMLSENLDATSAAFRVGYSDASHFKEALWPAAVPRHRAPQKSSEIRLGPILIDKRARRRL